MSIIRQVNVGGETYDIYAMGLWKDSSTQYSTADLIQLINDAANAGFEPVIVTTLPTANAANYETAKGKIYLKAESTADGQQNGYDEYIMVRTGTTTYTYKWEVIGHTGLELAGIKTVSTSANTSAASTTTSGASSATNTGSAGGATINGANFTVSDAEAHTHSITPSYVYAKTGAAASIASTDKKSVVTGITSTAVSVPKAGTATTVATGAASATVSVIGGVTYSTNKLKLTSITPVAGTTDAVGSRTAFTPVVGITNSTTSITPIAGTTTVAASYAGSFAKLTTAEMELPTNAIKSYSGASSRLTTATGYGTGTTTVYSAGANVSVLNSVSPNNATFSISVANDVLTIGSTIAVSGVTLTTGATNVAGTRTSVTVSNGTSFTYATGAIAEGSTGATIMTGLGTANAADTTTVVYATGGTSSQATNANVGQKILIGLGTRTEATVATAATTSLTVVTDVTASTETQYSAGELISVATAGTAKNVADGSLTTTGDGASVVISAAGTGAGTAIKTLATTSITPVNGTTEAIGSVSISGTADVLTGFTAATVVTGFTTTASTGAQKLVSDATATGSAGGHSHTLSGTQTIAAHSHSMEHTHSIAHTHSVTIPALSITLPNE